MEKTDAELIEQYRAGDTSALPILIQRHLKAVYIYVWRFTANKQDAEDITQEVFIKMWKKIAQYRQDKNFKTWLFTIARNAAIDWLRKKKDIPLSEFETEEGENQILESLPDIGPLPDELARAAEQKHIVDTALQTLPRLYREVLILHYLNDMTFDEIGRIANKSLNTVKSQHRRALIQLRKLLTATH